MCVYGSTKRHKFLTLNCTDDTFFKPSVSKLFWHLENSQNLIVYFSKMLKENLRNWFSFRSNRAKFGKCLIRNFLYLRELDTTKTTDKQNMFLMNCLHILWYGITGVIYAPSSLALGTRDTEFHMAVIIVLDVLFRSN